ncbi:MAG TPA: TlpA disulfide reductase family protein [Calidithermus sp.]|nr:TlpA disulfide reductase family protein [Calidithermus sp.]
MTRRLALALILGLAWSAAVRPAAADPSRFLPWTDPPPAAAALADLNGRPVSPDEFRGKVVLVSFWATWCEFCREQMLAMQRLKQRLAGQPFDILAINFGESTRRVREYLRDLPVDLRVAMDPDQSVARAWRVRVLPVNYLVGPDGRPRYTVLGEYDWASDEAVAMIRRLLP